MTDDVERLKRSLLVSLRMQSLMHAALTTLLDTDEGIVLDARRCMKEYEVDSSYEGSDFLFLMKGADGKLGLSAMVEHEVVKHGAVVKLNG